MIKNLKNIAVATAILGTSLYAAENKIELAGTAEITYKNEKSGSTNNAYNETEINLTIDAENKDGIEFHSEFVAYDGVQGYVADNASPQDTAAGTATSNEAPTSGMETKQAYIVAPLGKVKLLAGLIGNATYGLEAFDDGGESWKTALVIPFSKNLNARIVSKKIEEESKDKGTGDSDATVARVDANYDDLTFGVRAASMVISKDENEMKKSLLSAYLTTKISNFDLGFEYTQEGQDFDGKGFMLSVSSNITEDLNLGLSYVSLADGLKGGSDFAPGEIIDGNLDSSATKDTTAFILPVEFALNDELTLSAKYIQADVQGDDVTETDFGAEYSLGEATSITATYANLTSDSSTIADKQTLISLAVATEF